MIDKNKLSKIDKLQKIITESNPDLKEGIENVIIQDFFGGDIKKINYYNSEFPQIVYANLIDETLIGSEFYKVHNLIYSKEFSFKKSIYVDRNNILLLEQDVQNYLKTYRNIAIKFITEESKSK